MIAKAAGTHLLVKQREAIQRCRRHAQKHRFHQRLTEHQLRGVGHQGHRQSLVVGAFAALAAVRQRLPFVAPAPRASLRLLLFHAHVGHDPIQRGAQRRIAAGVFPIREIGFGLTRRRL